MFAYLFNIRRWSFGFKTALAGLIVLVAFIALTGVSIEAQVSADNERQLRVFLESSALTRRARLETALQDSLLTLSQSIGTNFLRPRLLRILRTTGTPTGADIVARSELSELLRFRLVDNGQFESLIVLTKEGKVSASVYPIGVSVPQVDIVGADNSQTTSFRGAQDSEILGETQRIIVYRVGNEDRVEVVQVLQIDNAVTGYVVGRINVQRVLLDNITDIGDAPEAARSYLATRSGDILADDSITEVARASALRSPVGLALAGQSGFGSYVVDEGTDSTPTLGYYSPVAGTALALITETSNESVGIPFLLTVLEDNLWFIPALAIIIGLVVLLIWRDIHNPVRVLQQVLQVGYDEELQMDIPALDRNDAMGELTRDIIRTRQQFHDSTVGLNEQLAQRDRDIEATQEVARLASNQRDLEKLMQEVIALMIHVFPNIYHAQIFLNDPAEEFSVLRASTGDVGKKLLARGHRLAIGGQSVIGRTTSEGRLIAVLDTQASDVHRPNELLPNTRAELAIPLRIGSNIIGALDVQSIVPNSFTAEQITTLEIMADQIAISLENARLYQDSVRALEEIARVGRDATGESWRTHLFGVRTQALQHYSGTPTTTQIDNLRQMTTESGVSHVGQITDTQTIPFSVPIRLRGQVLGAAVWELPASQFSEDKVTLAEELVNRLAVSLDNARLFEESERATARERLVNDIAAKITSQTAVDAILTTAVREVGQALQSSNVRVRLGNVRSARQGSAAQLFGDETYDSAEPHSNGNGHTHDPSDQ